MDMEGTIKPSPLQKKLSKMLRVLLIMVRKGISKTKLALDFHLTLKRGNKLAGKAIGNLLMLHHHHRSSNNSLPSSFKNEYEFSCSSTPNYYQQLFFHPATNRNKLHHHHRSGAHNTDSQLEEDAATVASVQRVLEMLDNNNDSSNVGPISPLVKTLPVVGNIGGRHLRITDSPFPLEDRNQSNIHEESVKVNEAADEFIMKFYSNLMKQTPS